MSDLSVELGAFFGQFKLRSYRKRDIIIHEDDVPAGVYYVKSGYVRMYSLSRDGEELTRIIVGPRDIFPLRWALTCEPIDFFAEPMTDVLAWHAPREEFLAFVTSSPARFMELSQMVAHRMGNIYKRLGSVTWGNSYQKIASVFTALSEQFGETTEGGTRIAVPLTHKDIASLAGVCRETVSLEMEQLKRSGLIDYHGQTVVIRDIKGLEEASSAGC